MLHGELSEEAAAIAATTKLTKKDVADVVGALLTLLLSTAVLSGLLQLI